MFRNCNRFRDLKFGLSGNTGGWNVISSSEVSGDGKNRTEQMLATTEGVSAVKGGTKAFVGKNEEMKTEKYDGDDKNFTYSTGESSNMVLNENIVTGDDRNRRTENKSSSVSHSTNIVKSSTNSGINDNDMQQQLMDDNVSRQSSTNTNKSSSTSNNSTTNQRSSTVSSSNDNSSNQLNSNSNATHVMSAADQQRLNQQLSKESGQVQEAFRLAQQPGNVISHTVERANPTTNMITEKKELADGTIVTTKRYETINSDNVDSQTSRNVNTDNNTRSNINKNNTTQSQNHENSSQTTKNVKQTTKIDSRDEEAFRQAEKQGTVISRNVEMSDPTTRMITEKKELADGTIVTTKKYEKVTSENTKSRNSNTNRNSNTFENTDTQHTGRDTSTASNNNFNAEDVNKTSNNVNQTFKSSRDEEAFRLADKQGTVLSRNVEMTDPTTRMITEKKQLADGTVVTTKKFEKITSENTQSSNSNTNRNSTTFDNTDTSRDTKNTTSDKFNAENVKKTINNVNQTFKSSRDEEAFRLAEKQGTVISRNVEMTDPTTRMITEKKQLADGTVVTTKKYEKITSSTDNDNQSNRNVNQNQKSTKDNSKTEIVHNVKVVRENSNSMDSQSKHNQTNNQTKDNQNTTVHNTTETFKTPRDEEAFRLAQQPGKVISRQVDLANPTTRVITEKKELTDGTVVTTKRYETITSDNVNTQSTRNTNRDNVETQNVKKIVQNTNQSTNVNKTNTQRNDNFVDDNSRREIVEETVTKKLFDTSCHCPEMDHKNHSRNTKEFINTERDDHKTYDVNFEIITTDDRKVKQNNNTFAENEKQNEEVVRRRENNNSEQTRRDEQVRKENRPDYINKKISVELDASHKAFASSLRCVTPPNGRISTPSSSRNEIRSQRSPSRETTSSKISSATTTLRKNSGDFMRPTKSSDLRSSIKGSSPEKQPKKVYKDTLEKTTVVDTDSTVVNESTTRDGKSKSAEAPRNSRDKSPKNSYPGTDDTRDKSPQKMKPSVTSSKPRESSPQKSHPAGVSSSPRESSPDKSYLSRENSSPREKSPQKSHPPGISSSPRESSPNTSYPSRENSSPRDEVSSSPRDKSPQKSHLDSGVVSKPTGIASRPRDDSPQKSSPRDKPTGKSSSPRDNSPQKSTPESEKPIARHNTPQSRDSSPQKSFPSRESSSLRDHPVESSTSPRDQSPQKGYPNTEKISPRDKSPLKTQSAKIPATRDSSPQKGTTGIFRNPNDSTSQKYQPTTELSYPCDKSPEPLHFGKNTPIEILQQKYQPAVDLPQKAFPGLEPVSTKDRRNPNHNEDFERNPSQNSGQSTPREKSPNYSESGSSTPRGMSPIESFPEFESTTPTNQSPHKSQPGSRENSLVKKPSTVSGKSTLRDSLPQKTNEKPSRPDSGNSTPRDRSPIKPTYDSPKKTHQTDKRISPTTSVSDLEYFTSDPRLVTDLDYENNEETQIDYESQTDTYEKTSSTIDRRLLNKKKPQDEKPSDVKESTKKPSEKAPFNRNRSETFEERASKLIGKQTETTEQYDRVSKKVSKPSSPTKSSPDTNTSTNRVSEIRERKAKIEKETANIEKMTVNKKKSVTSSSNDFINRERMEQRIHKDRVISKSPDQSPERGSTRNTNDIKQKTNNRTSVNDDVTQTKTTTNNVKILKVTREPSTKQTDVPSYLMPTETARRRMTSEDEQTLRKSPTKSQSRPKTSDETSEPKNHISVAKINISPIRSSVRTTTKSTYDKTINESSKTLKLAPSIMLVKRPLTDVSSTEPDSDQEYDHELLQNVDKSTTTTIRKKLIQNRKDSAPVQRTTEKEKISRSTSENMFKSDTSTLKRRTSKDTTTKESSPKKDMKRPVKCVTTKTINLTAINDNKSFNSNTLDDVIIHVQQAKSSREPSPNKSVPIPVRPDEIINEKQTIYPDSVTEPDDDRKFKPKRRVTNIPIFEEKTNQYVGIEITEVETNINELLEEDEDDEIDEETERSIINSFTLEKADRKRNSIQIDALDDEDTLDENEEEEIRQMSVSAKVDKFMSTAEQVKKPKSSAPFKPDDINIEDISEPEDDSLLSVNQKRNKFSKPSVKPSTQNPKEVYRNTVSRPRDEVDESLIEDDCLLSVSDKVSKFISTAEKLASSTPQKSPELVKNIMRQTSKPQYEDDLQDNVHDYSRNKETISTLTKDDRSDSRSTLRSETSQITLKSTEAIKRAREIFETNSTANRDIARHSDIMSRPSVFEAKRTPTAERKVYKDTTTTSKNLQERRSSRDRQSHSPLKETSAPLISKAPVERGPASRGDPKEHNSVKKDLSSPKSSTTARIVEDRKYPRERQSQSPNKDQGSETPVLSRKVPAERTPGYLKDQVSSKKDLFEKKISSSRIETSDTMSYHPKSISPQTSVDEDRIGETHYTSRKTSQTSDKPSYMCHTVASREHINAERSESETRETRTSRRDSETRRESLSRLSNPKYDRNVSESTNDSIMHQFDETSKAPKSPTKFGVELKRTDSLRNTQTTTTSTRKISASGDTFDVEEIFDLEELERLMESVVGYEQRRCIRAQIRVVKKMIADKKLNTSSSTSRNERVSTTNYSKNTSSPTRKSRDEPSFTQTKVTPSRVTAVHVPVHERITRDDSRLSTKSSEMTSKYTTDRATTDSRLSHNKNISSRTTDRNTPTTPRGIIESLNKNNKGKVESAVKTTKKTTTSSSSTSSFSTHSKMRESSEQAKETDCITSSYGVGPTDSNGLPLFGLRALKKKNPSVTTESKSK